MGRISVVTVAAGLFLLSALFALLQAGEKESMKAVTLEGILVDTKCYAMGAFLTDDHTTPDGKKLPSCATACATMGLPVALVTKDNKVHILAVPSKEYAKWMARELRVTGMPGQHVDVFIPEKLEVKENGKWVEKELPATMM